MDYNEEKAKELIEKYKLSGNTLKVWKCRGKIPDKYLSEDYERTYPVGKADKIRLARINEIYKSEVLNFIVLSELAKVPYQRFLDAIRGKGRISPNEIDRIELEIKRIRTLVNNNIKFNDPDKLKKIFNCKAIKIYKVIGKENWGKSMYHAMGVGNRMSKNDYERLKDCYFRFLIETNP